MPYTIETLQDKNIILVTFTDLMTDTEVLSSVSEVVDIAKSMPRPVYQIGDFRQAEGTFASVFKIVRTFPTMWRVYTAQNITGPIAVNDLNNPWLKMSSDLGQKLKLSKMLAFATVEDALAHIAEQETDPS